ncbi:MAG: outer membrane beta-barrel protein [Bacteroidetes bacterium]|nr:outer membrane beta-barrel protein [Bacteroidota bacterium]MCL2302451.1 outer membrane beta-barrel protein [Lentimicrobiaceae bacterium]
MKKLYLLLLLIFSTIYIQAQNNAYTINGTIIDNSSNAPLFYVNVGLLNETDSTIISVASTDKDGIFTFSNVKDGNYILRTSYIGYDVYQQPISVTGENKEITIEPILLQPSASMLQNINITTTKPVFMNDGEKILYNVSEDPSVQTGTAADALQNAPGVEVDIEGNITLRGVSSVEIWINGRPSRLEAENLKTYIQQLPANALERIEVINNPSARYSASGTGGIINIVTKSNIKKNSFISFGINGSTRPMASPWFSYMYSNEKFSINLYLYGNYNFYKEKSYGYNIILNENMDTSSYRSYTSEGRDNSIWTGAYLYGSYNFDSLKTLSFWGGGWGMPWGEYTSFQDYKYREFINNPGIYDYTQKLQNSAPRFGGNLGIEYEHNFNDEGHKLLTEMWGWFQKSKGVLSFQRTYDNYPELNTDKKRTSNDGNHGMGGEIHYSLPYHKNGMIEIGADGYYHTEIVHRRTDTLFTDIYILDSMRYENAVFHAGDINAYITVQHKFGGFTIKGGLRSQNRFIKYYYINRPEHDDKKTLAGLFPSLHLTYATKSMHNFNLSYTRRVNYPRTSQLTTFIIYYEDSFTTGNPDLKSTYTNSIEGGWTKYFNKFGSVGISAYFRNSKDEINNLTDVVYSDFFGRHVSFTMPVNSGKSHRYGTDVNVMWKLKAFMNIRLNASIYQSHSETLFRDYEDPVITDFFAYSFRLNFWAKVWKFLEINASGNYRSKTKTIFFEDQPTYSINCGLRSDFWNRKISVFLNVQDIFNWGRQRNNNTNPYYIAYSSSKWNSRFISAGITFRFGKIEMESKARTGGNTE